MSMEDANVVIQSLMLGWVANVKSQVVQVVIPLAADMELAYHSFKYVNANRGGLEMTAVY